MKLSKFGKGLFGTIESIALAMIVIGCFKYYSLSFISLAIFIINAKFISDHI